LAGREDPIDVEPFQGQRARLHPRDNLSEKRVFGAVQFWDPVEREALSALIASGPSGQPFVFVDAGANVGLYTLFARSASAGRPFRGLAIEPDTENRRRLAFNLTASGADDVAVSPMALSDVAGEARLAGHGDNRGQVALGDEGVLVPTAPLAQVIAEAGLERIDALKIDIEGMEKPVLGAYLSSVPQDNWPELVILETVRGGPTPALDLCVEHGYQVATRARMNAVLRLDRGGRDRG
jgi:FkbM family methyltransferase